ncbi:hypothetical protein ACHAWC_003170 [Mediolabrus comicus]
MMITSRNKPIILHESISMDEVLTSGFSSSQSPNIVFKWVISLVLGGILLGTILNIVFKWVISLVLGGILLGTILPQNETLPSATWRLLSSIIGYIYFLAWSSSFYPQIVMNYERQTTRGLSVDFCVLNVLGYCCYGLYTTTFFWNQGIAEEYKRRFSSGGDDINEKSSEAEITVQGNDVAFAIHALIMASVTLSQVGVYDTFKSRPPSKRVIVIIFSTISFCVAYVCFTWAVKGDVDFLGFLYVLGMVKLGVTIGKYVPQVLLNKQRKSTVGWNVKNQRKSTVGWNVKNVILDLTGGILSLIQLVGDCASMKDYSGLVGNPVKIVLSLVTIFFDVIFLLQHYVMYPDRSSYTILEPQQPSIEAG